MSQSGRLPTQLGAVLPGSTVQPAVLTLCSIP